MVGSVKVFVQHVFRLPCSIYPSVYFVSSEGKWVQADCAVKRYWTSHQRRMYQMLMVLHSCTSSLMILQMYDSSTPWAPGEEASGSFFFLASSRFALCRRDRFKKSACTDKPINPPIGPFPDSARLSVYRRRPPRPTNKPINPRPISRLCPFIGLSVYRRRPPRPTNKPINPRPISRLCPFIGLSAQATQTNQ